jgi:hypothetical protein
MKVFEIEVPDDKIHIVKDRLKELGITYKEIITSNTDTIAAMNELRAGKGMRFKNVEQLFNSI